IYRAPTRSLLLTWTSTRPVNSRSLNKLGGLRSMGANSTGADVTPSETTNVFVAPVVRGAPAATVYGPMAFNAATARFPGKAASNCPKPLGVGVRAVPELWGLPADRILSK